MLPSGFRPKGDDEPIRITETSPGLYKCENVYNGTYEFFEGRPIPELPDLSEIEDVGDRLDEMTKILEQLGLVAPNPGETSKVILDGSKGVSNEEEDLKEA